MAKDAVRSEKYIKGRTLAPQEFVKMWPTPRSAPSGPDYASLTRHSNGISLATAVALWPTPSANEYRTMDRDRLIERREQCKATVKNGNGFGLTLGNALTMAGESGALNPMWVEWLMGFPLGWTALDLSETPSSRKSRKSSGGQS